MPSNRSHSKAQAIIGSPTKGTKNAGRWKDVWKMVKARRQATNAWRVYNAARVNFQWYFAFHIKTEDVTPLRQAKPAMMNDIHAVVSALTTLHSLFPTITVEKHRPNISTDQLMALKVFDQNCGGGETAV
mmetsp:Transcript_58413/g.136727  ORF Transcript_58413/g.136727 Transcript_58413/m.136727 type:complete len:130 (+) Transcript_58413:403-792(+)